jgi:hypothetical protein
MTDEPRNPIGSRFQAPQTIAGTDYLAPYVLEVGLDVEVELLVNDNAPPHRVDGIIEAGTPAALVLRRKTGRRLRVPWAAIATITDAPTPPPTHPADL